MKKILFSLIIISIAFIGIGILSAADVSNHGTDLSNHQETQHAVQSGPKKNPDLWDTFGWNKDHRHQRGIVNDDFQPIIQLDSHKQPDLSNALKWTHNRNQRG